MAHNPLQVPDTSSPPPQSRYKRRAPQSSFVKVAHEASEFWKKKLVLYREVGVGGLAFGTWSSMVIHSWPNEKLNTIFGVFANTLLVAYRPPQSNPKQKTKLTIIADAVHIQNKSKFIIWTASCMDHSSPCLPSNTIPNSSCAHLSSTKKNIDLGWWRNTTTAYGEQR